MNSTTLKKAAASIGAGAVITAGALTAASTSWAEPEDPGVPGPVPTAEATLGETSTETTLAESTAAETPTTSSAAPEITGPAPLPPEEEGLPG